jgi:hypothetical protein
VVRRLIGILIAGLVLAACAKHAPSRNLDLDLIRVTEAHMRTDTVGDGKFASVSTFVLVDAENHGSEGAYVSLGGELQDDEHHKVGDLNVQALYIPPGEARTYALVDTERVPRPTATSAKILVTGALIPEAPPVVRVEPKEIDDRDKIVMQGIVTNGADRPARAIVIASFHDERGKPMTRPFVTLELPAGGHAPVQFVGPRGSKHGTIFVGDAVF